MNDFYKSLGLDVQNNPDEWLIENNNIFGGWFNDWRKARVAKINSILKLQPDQNKVALTTEIGDLSKLSILECGAGFGNTGLYYKSQGADVTFSDIRQDCLNEIAKKDKEAKILRVNNEKDWSTSEPFDIVLHLGLSCHVENWKQDLLCAVQNTRRVLFFETAVNKFSNLISFVIENPEYHHEYHGPGTFDNQPTIGSLPSVSSIEAVLDTLKVNYTRYDDADLNVNNLIYTNPCNEEFKYPLNDIGEETEPPYIIDGWDNPAVSGGRKFWTITKG